MVSGVDGLAYDAPHYWKHDTFSLHPRTQLGGDLFEHPIRNDMPVAVGDHLWNFLAVGVVKRLPGDTSLCSVFTLVEILRCAAVYVGQRLS